MDDVFTEHHVFASDQVRRGDARPETGFRAVADNHLYRGYDWGALSESLDFLAVDYNPVVMEKLRSYGDDSTRTGLVFDAVENLQSHARARWLPWYSVLHEVSMLWCSRTFGDAHTPAPHSALLPDGRGTAPFATLAEHTRSVRAGMGALLQASIREEARIAIFDNPVSVYLNNLLQEGRGGESSVDMDARYMAILEQLGHHYDYVNSSRVRGGELHRYSVLILPSCHALDDRDADAIRSFVAGGGALITEGIPGMYDTHGALRAKSPLGDLFGGSRAPAGIQPAVLSLSPEASGNSTNWSHEIGAFLSELGCQAPWQFLKEDVKEGRHFEGERFRFRFGKAEILGLLASPTAEESQKVQLSFPKKSSAYVWSTEGTRAIPGKFHSRLDPGDVRFFIVLPYDTTALHLVAALDGRKLAVAISIEARKASPGDHMVRLTLQSETGKVFPEYSQNVLLKDGEAAVSVPLIGNCKVEAVDLLTGTQSSTIFRADKR
jgi:hypothetical protein